MKKEIFIVHDSEIIRCGLASIIRKYFNIEITQVNVLEDLKSFTDISNNNIIMMIEDETAMLSNIVQAIKENNALHFITINTNKENNQKLSEENTISLQTPNSKIQKIISRKFRNSENQQDESSENGELTTREKDVLKLVALGHSNKEMADQLYISIHTVISHRKNITEKLGIKSISGLTVYAILNKLIDTNTINPEDLI